jgi:UDP-N-acetylglucosamine 4,6-dehydratase
MFLEQRKRGKITVTDPRMTRFWITLDQSVNFVIRCVEQMHGGEIFVPKIPSMQMIELARTVAQGCEIETVGVRPGEKLHETLVSEDEARHTFEVGDMYVIQPSHVANGNSRIEGRALPDGFRYASDTNSRWMSEEDLRELIADFDPDKSSVPA